MTAAGSTSTLTADQARRYTRSVALRFTQIERPTMWLVRDQRGRHEEVEPFYLSKSVVTNAQYASFDPRHAPPPASPGPNHPAVNLTFAQAQAYSTWYSDVSGKAFRIPTIAEWSVACGDLQESDEVLLTRICCLENAERGAPEVEARRPNPLGLHDLPGTVREWVSGPNGPRVAGGSFRTPLVQIRRLPIECVSMSRADDVGFRVARSLRS